MKGNPETDTDPTGQRYISGDDPATSETGWVNPNGAIVVASQTFAPRVIGYTRPWPTPVYYPPIYHPPIRKVTPRPVPRRVVHHPSSPSIGDDAKTVGLDILDATTGIPSMINDVHTIFGTSAPWYDKLGAGLDLGFNAVSDVLMLTGVGEAMRGIALGEHVGADLLEHVGEDAIACETGLSFIATTVVATSLGEQAIGGLHPGEQVWAYNPSTKKMELQPILHVWINHDNDLVNLTITHTIKQGKGTKAVSEVIHTNRKHPFLTVEEGFLPVGQIVLGMHLVEADGETGVVSGWTVVPGVMTMYNLEVAQDHTFVVGMGMWVVHNCGNELVPPEPENLTFDSGQVGQKWGKHMRDYPEMTDYNEYKAKAQGIFDNPDKVSYNPEQNGGRFHYTKGNDLVIVRDTGEFESLYPGANTPVVLKGILVR